MDVLGLILLSIGGDLSRVGAVHIVTRPATPLPGEEKRKTRANVKLKS